MRPVVHADAPLGLKQAAETLDQMAAGLAEFGTIGISSPLLALPAAAPFEFELTTSADQFYTDAKTAFQGRAAEFEQISQSLSFGASIAADPTIATAHAAQMTEYLQAQRQNAFRQSLLDEKLRLQNQAAATTYRQERADAEAAYKQALSAAGADDSKRAAAESARAAAVSAAIEKYALALQVPDAVSVPSLPDTPAQPAGADPALLKDAAAARGRIAGMTGFGGLLGDTPDPTLSNRSAIITAAGDTATAAIFKFLSNPNFGDGSKDRIVAFGVSMVSVNPGWRTKRGYAADISVAATYEYRPADRDVIAAFLADESRDPSVRRRIADSHGVPPPPPLASVVPAKSLPPGLRMQDQGGAVSDTPLVAAVSPMTETDALDLSSGYRRQDEFALNLSFALRMAGLGAQASAFEQFVKSRQQDVATASSVAAVNAYSYSGGEFGFQVGPRLRAMAEIKARRYSGPADVLDRQSFPVLILFGLDRAGLYRIRVDESGEWRLYQAQVRLVSLPSWLPLEESTADARLRESTRLRWRVDMEQALAALDPKKDPSVAAGAGLAMARATSMRWKVFGSGVDLEVPVKVFRESVEPPAGKDETKK